MADVFISYAREDRLAAERIAAALGRHGWSVWWDANIPPGKTWDELIERELVAASCAVVLWSAASLARAWVKTEAADALARGVLVPVLIENVTPPIAFRHVQAAPLMDWRNDLEHAGFQQLLCSVCALAGLPARPKPEDVGRAFRLGRTRGKGAVVSARTGRTATLSTAPLVPAAKPAPTVLATTTAPQARMSAKRDVGSAEAGNHRRYARALALGALALVAATVGYGANDALDWWLAPPALLAADRLFPGTAADPACMEPAAAAEPAALSKLPFALRQSSTRSHPLVHVRRD